MSYAFRLTRSAWYQPNVKVFRVEYYDLRHANSAYAALHGQVLFGMKLQVSGRDRASEDQTHRGQHVQEAQLHPSASSVDSPQNVIPFPTSTGTTAYQDEGPLQLGPPGQYSHTRERFMYTDPARSRPRSVSAGHDGYTTSFSPSPTPPHPGVPSPTFFYTSMPTGGTDAIAPSQDHQTRQPSGHFALDTMERPHGFLGNNSDGRYNTVHSHSPEQANRSPEGNSVPWEGETPVAQLPGSHHECYYCPSRGASSDCYTYPPRSTMYSPVQRSPLVPPSLPLSPPAPMFGTGYNYNNHHALPTNHAMNMNMANSFEQSMISRPATGETWFPTPNMVPHGFPGVQFYPQPVQVPGGYGNYPPPLKPEPPLQIDSPLHTSDIIYRTNSSASPPSSRLTGRATSPRSSANNTRESATPPERNQLNLARIEDGQDTRTTVMIKNIPNKMSDKDLIAFIAKVCPCKIDFLYLRMDFQNGMVFFIVSNDLMHWL
jgi:RNA recognition motif 2